MSPGCILLFDHPCRQKASTNCPLTQIACIWAICLVSLLGGFYILIPVFVTKWARVTRGGPVKYAPIRDDSFTLVDTVHVQAPVDRSGGLNIREKCFSKMEILQTREFGLQFGKIE